MSAERSQLLLKLFAGQSYCGAMSFSWNRVLKSNDRLDAQVTVAAGEPTLELIFTGAYSGKIYSSWFSPAILRGLLGVGGPEPIDAMKSIRDCPPDVITQDAATAQILWGISNKGHKLNLLFELRCDYSATDRALVRERRLNQSLIQQLLARLESVEERLMALETAAAPPRTGPAEMWSVNLHRDDS